MARLRISHAVFPFSQSPDFLKGLWERLAAFQPEFILTINHAGLDGEGKVLELLRRCRTPLASWFVDRHELYFRGHSNTDDLLAVFTWNPAALESLKQRGISRAIYLPLGTDPEVFTPGRAQSDMAMVSFVGSSWTGKIAANLRAGKYPAGLLRCWRTLGQDLERAEAGQDVRHAWIACRCPGIEEDLSALDEMTATLYFRLIQLEASRIRRLRRVRQLLAFSPLVVGDTYWKRVLKRDGSAFAWLARLDYEKELPLLYRSSPALVDIPTLQSSAAVNQRAFDVPACGGFVVSESSPALDELFEPGLEAVSYQNDEDMLLQISRWLKDKQGRHRIMLAARKRILAQHTYEHRLIALIRRMHEAF